MNIKISSGTAALFNTDIKIKSALITTAYLMIGDRCLNNCSFCSKAKNSNAESGLLARINWIPYNIETVARRISEAYLNKKIERVCLQAVYNPESFEWITKALTAIKKDTDIPVSISFNPLSFDQIKKLFSLGADRIGIALDAASKEIYGKIKEGEWESKLDFIKRSAMLHPGKITTHIIAGLGETEKDIVNIIQNFYLSGITTGLFAFYPVPGTSMEHADRPSLSAYRRIQIALFLIYLGVDPDTFAFSNGKITDFGISENNLAKLLADGKVFRTTGCPGCNRPYYNEIPGEDMYNYYRQLFDNEFLKAFAEIKN